MITLYSQNVWNAAPAAFRNKLTDSIIRRVNPDVCAFQECGPYSIRTGEAPLPELISDLYTEVCPELSEENYTAVFYKKDKFSLLDSGYFLYDGFNDANSKSVCWGLLEEKETGIRFVLASTHFWWKIDSEQDFLQRIENANQLKAFCDEITAKYQVPVIIGGDFNNGKNSEQGDEPYQYMLKQGFCDIRLTAEETTDEYTHHDYPKLMEDGTYLCPTMPERNIDYIFTYGKNAPMAKRFEILTDEISLTSSDHCPLIGYFEF